MHHRYESQPFQIVRQINNFSTADRVSGLRERNDFNNLPNSPQANNQTVKVEKIEKSSFGPKDSLIEKNRSSYLNAPIRKIWESDWTLIIPETHKENGSIFWMILSYALFQNHLFNILMFCRKVHS